MGAKAMVPSWRNHQNQKSVAARPQCHTVRLPLRQPQGQDHIRAEQQEGKQVEGTMLHQSCMMALFNNARIQIQVDNVLIRRRVPEKDTGEVVAVQFGPPIPRTLYTHPRSKGHNSLSAKSVVAGEKLIATYSISM
jgi:hypothetical protein